jgi:EAL domain-containing protein (putative c-di-GMP-specific phosphodiesterase class I)
MQKAGHPIDVRSMKICDTDRVPSREGYREVLFQPVIDLEARRPVAVAALTAPGVPIGTHALRAACVAAARMAFADGALELRVGIAADQLCDRETLVAVVAALRVSGLPAARLVLEVSAETALPTANDASGVLRELGDVGVRFGVDHFGVGSSSLSHLRRLQPAHVQIDASLVCQIASGSDPRAGLLVHGLVALGTIAGADVTAGGVETWNQVERLREMGCRFGQGPLWSRAVAEEELPGIIREASADVDWTTKRRRPSRRNHAVVEDAGAVAVISGLQRAGASSSSIAAALNGQGFTRSAGKHWHRATVERVMHSAASGF